MIEILVFAGIVLVFGVIPAIYYFKNHERIEKEKEIEEKKPFNKKVFIVNIIWSLGNFVFLIYQKEYTVFFICMLIILYIFISEFDIFSIFNKKYLLEELITFNFITFMYIVFV